MLMFKLFLCGSVKNSSGILMRAWLRQGMLFCWKSVSLRQELKTRWIVILVASWGNTGEVCEKWTQNYANSRTGCRLKRRDLKTRGNTHRLSRSETGVQSVSSELSREPSLTGKALVFKDHAMTLAYALCGTQKPKQHFARWLASFRLLN
jgi:hypothetical protein